MQSAHTIAEALEEYATLLEFQGENVFKIRAFRAAALVVRDNANDIGGFLANAKAGSIAGIGKQLTHLIEHLYTTGEFAELSELRKKSPAGLEHLLRVPGLGTKKLKTLYTELKIQSLEDLEAACRKGRVASLKGFGEKTEQQILAGVSQIRTYRGKFLLSQAWRVASEIVGALDSSGVFEGLFLTGALRRKCEVVESIDLFTLPKDSSRVAQACLSIDGARPLPQRSENEYRFSVRSDLPVNVFMGTKAALPAALVWFTGNEAHREKVCRIAAEKGFKLDAAGLTRNGKAEALADEAALYRALGLAFIPPELREGGSEFEVAGANPRAYMDLLEAGDIKGILHAHTTWSDGRHTLREMAVATQAAGYQYLGISDHSKSAAYAGGLSVERIAAQQEEIDQLNQELAPFRIFKGIESDILMDGSLDYPEEVLASFDFVIASVHSYLTMGRTEMTGRILRAIRNPCTTILGHMTGRLLLERDGYDADFEALLKNAGDEKVAVELNTNPHRLDIDWRLIPLARSLGIRIPLCPDAHSVEGLRDLEYGVGIARKGGLTAPEVLNCLEADALQEFFQEKR